MTRRATSSLTDESQKENSGLRDRGSLSNIGTVKVKKEKQRSSRRTRAMSEDEDEGGYEQSQPNGTLRHGHGDQEDDAEGEPDEEEVEGGDEEVEGSTRSRKRARANTVGDSVPLQSQAEPKEERRVTLPRDTDGYIPGSIVRIRLENFVTYDSVEFKTGAHLNMILGPNGTGKSSIACAICLGLNFPPKVLGRASELGSFVKHGAKAGYIEIELKGPKGEPNLIIRRDLKAGSKSSHFTINKKDATGTQVNAAMVRLNVQVSNLCSFLPQDKVAEFARMSPQQLLRETQRAAGNENLTQWHDTLITAGKDLKAMQENLKTDQDHLNTMKERNAGLERDVRRYEERLQIEKRIQLLEVVLPYVEYMEAMRVYHDAKDAHKKAHSTLKEVREKQTPLNERRSAMDRQHKALDQQRERKKADARRKFDVVKRKWTESDGLESQGDELKTRLDQLKSREKNRNAEIKKQERIIAEIQNKLANPPKLEDIEPLQVEMKSLKSENRQLTNRQKDLHDKQRVCIDDEAKQNKIILECNQRLQQLDDVNLRKLEKLTKDAPDCADAVRWIRQNRDKFKMEVLEPPVLSLNIPDKKYAKAIEACFSKNQLRTLVAQCDEDYRYLNRVLTDSPEGVGRILRLNTWFKPSTSDRIAPVPMSREELATCGFDGYALDYVDCPEPLKAFLQSDMNLHRTAVALNGAAVNSTMATELISRAGGNCSYVAGDVLNTVIRSRYGKRLALNTTRDIRPPNYFGAATVDPAAKREVGEKKSEAEYQLQLCHQRAEELGKEESEIRKASQEIKRKHDELERRKDETLKAHRMLASLKVQRESAEAKLTEQRNLLPVDQERASLKRKLLAITKKRMVFLKDYETLLRDTIQEQNEATRVGLQFLQISANKIHLEALYQDQMNELTRVTEEYEQARERYENAKAESHALLDTSQEKYERADEETGNRFQDMEKSGEALQKSSEEWKVELEDERQRLETSVRTNPGVIEQYRKRVEDIKNLTAAIEEREEKIQKKERQIHGARNNWEPALQKLVDSVGEKFSAAFDRIGCAGEIKISPHEDYEKWAIDILVKFRDSERLQLLTGERQSGGERSLTTILYLMSLTEEARTPFSLVDEINQGMDARAERAVHNSLVEVTCKKDSGQYFLITPKLLPDLLYHERMKILCVNNGEWLPEETSAGNLMGLVNNFVRHNGHSQATA